MSLEAAKEMWFDPIKDIGCKMTALVGNHDIYYKNTLRINAPNELLGDYDIDVIDEPTTRNYDGTDILFLPWICDENRDDTFRSITKSTAPVCMGHLELNGFEAHPGHVMDKGTDMTIFKNFKKVFSGHYHTRSNDGQVFYLGNPYEMYWNDCGDKRGFNILDTETGEIEFVENPYKMFEKIYYEDTPAELFKAHLYKDKIVKLFIRSRTSQLQYDKFLDKLMKAGIIDLKVVENTAINDTEVDLDSERIEDTLTLLNKYIQDSDFDLEKERVKTLLKEVYLEACETE